MTRHAILSLFVVAVVIFSAGCGGSGKKTDQKNDSTKTDSGMQKKLAQFATFKLTTDMSKLSDKEKQMIPLLIDAAMIMDDLYWMQTYGNKDEFLATIKDEDAKKFANINYGPWERLNDNQPFLEGAKVKTPGVNFYPADITKEEFEKLADKDKKSQYTVIVRNPDKSLKVVWYHEYYKDKLSKASDLIKQAAALCEDAGLKKYLELRADALMTSNYKPSDMAWMDMKTNKIDFICGPIENYEDGLFGYKSAFEGFVLVKDMEWSNKLGKFTGMLPILQKKLPVEDKYKKEVPAAGSDLGVYDAIYYAGDCNAGSKTIAINLPNDEDVQLKKGSRRLQLKNSMKAKFDNILMPIAKTLMDPSQMKNVKFDAFFTNVMFHEVGHGLGIKKTVNGKGFVRDALKDLYSGIEEAKADILGLFMATTLIEMKEITNITAEDCYVTFVAGIFRSVRFGAASAHGKANMMCFNFFEDNKAFTVNNDGTYKVDFVKVKEVVNLWAAKIITWQGNGDYDGLKAYFEKNSNIRPALQKELDRLKTANIPVDIIFDQGKQTLGLK
ncbi:MAG: Zn-dependent hydrolase [Bacteroidota bacterium]